MFCFAKTQIGQVNREVARARQATDRVATETDVSETAMRKTKNDVATVLCHVDRFDKSNPNPLD